MAEGRGCALTDLTLEDLQTLHPLFSADVMSVSRTLSLTLTLTLTLTLPRSTCRCSSTC